MQSLQARVAQTNLAGTGAEAEPLAVLAEDLNRLDTEIRALYQAALPPAVIHQISRGAREQAAIGRMMLDDCAVRATSGTLNPKHLANAKKWNAGVRRWIESRQTAYTTGVRRKLCIVRSGRPAQ